MTKTHRRKALQSQLYQDAEEVFAGEGGAQAALAPCLPPPGVPPPVSPPHRGAIRRPCDPNPNRARCLS